VSFTADGFAWVAERGPGQGRAEVYVDGVHAGHVRLWAASPKVPRIVFARGWTSAGSHEVKIVVVGTAGHPTVNVDAFAFLHPAA
jgi:hypothetical protein